MLIIAVIFATTCACSVKSIWNIAHRVCWPGYHLKILSTLKPANLVGFSTNRAGLKATSLWQSVGNSYMFHTDRHQSYLYQQLADRVTPIAIPLVGFYCI